MAADPLADGYIPGEIQLESSSADVTQPRGAAQSMIVFVHNPERLFQDGLDGFMLVGESLIGSYKEN